MKHNLPSSLRSFMKHNLGGVVMLVQFKDYLKSQNKSENTIDGYLRAVQNYITWFSVSYGKEPSKLIKQNVDEFRSYLHTVKRQNARTINFKLSSLKKYNEFLVDCGIQKEIVINDKMLLKVQQAYASPATITEKDVNQLRQACLEQGSKRNFALINLLAYCGVRVSEALGIRLADCENIFQTKELIIRNGKGNKQRTVYLNDKVLTALKDYMSNGRKIYKTAIDSEYLFVSNKNTNLDRITVNKMLNNYCENAKLINITPHQLRHFFCSNALEKGFTVAEVANIAGHSNIHTTLIYTNPSRTKMIEKVNFL